MDSNIILTNIQRIELRLFELDDVYAFGIYLYDTKGVLKTTIMINSPNKDRPFVIENYDVSKGEKVVDDIVRDFTAKNGKAEEQKPKVYKNFRAAGSDIYSVISILQAHYIKESIDRLWDIKTSLDESKEVEAPVISNEKWKAYFERIIGYELNEDDVRNLLLFMARDGTIQDMLKREYQTKPLFYSEGAEIKNTNKRNT